MHVQIRESSCFIWSWKSRRSTSAWGRGGGGYVVPPLPVPSLPLQSSPPHTPHIKQNKDLLKKRSRLNVCTLCVGPHSESPVEALGLVMCWCQHYTIHWHYCFSCNTFDAPVSDGCCRSQSRLPTLQKTLQTQTSFLINVSPPICCVKSCLKQVKIKNTLFRAQATHLWLFFYGCHDSDTVRPTSASGVRSSVRLGLTAGIY